MRLPALCLALALTLTGDARAAEPVRSADLKDPFARAAAPKLPPGTRPDAPPVAPPERTALSDLHDPFTARREALAADVQSELRNPFTAPRAQPETRDEIGLKNPFRRAARVHHTAPPSDLKNPFTRQGPPTRPRSQATTTPLRTPTTPVVPLQRPRNPSATR